MQNISSVRGALNRPSLFLAGKTVDRQNAVGRGKSGDGEETCVHYEGEGSTTKERGLLRMRGMSIELRQLTSLLSLAVDIPAKSF